MTALLGTPTALDRRRSVRGPLYMMVDTRGARVPLWAFDIGLGGMRCTGPTAWPGTYLDLSFVLPDDLQRIEVGGQVVSLGEADGEIAMGVRFCRISDGARLAIYRFLDRRRRLWAAD